jgi:predicted transglutaminase-like cysteine proteinase
MIALELATTVQRAVNAGVTYQSDAEQYGLPDIWREARLGGAGDCEDIALAKRRALLDAGAPPQALRLAICRTESAEMHLVLIATTDVGELVLDNRYAEPMPRQALSYEWFLIEEGGQWSTIAPA